MIYFVKKIKFFVDKKIPLCMLIQKKGFWMKPQAYHYQVNKFGTSIIQKAIKKYGSQRKAAKEHGMQLRMKGGDGLYS